MKSKKLTTVEAIMYTAGSGLGTGLLTIPYAVQKVGVIGTLIAISFAFIATLLINFYLADLASNSKNPRDLVDILKEHLFKGKFKTFFAIVFFVLLVFLVLENLIVYTLCASDMLSSLYNIDPIIIKCIFTLVASTMLFAGLKNIGVGEKYVVSAIGIVVFGLVILSFFNVNNSLPLFNDNYGNVLALYGLFMFAFSSIFSMVQISAEIENKKDLKKAIVLGLLVNAIITLIYSSAAILCSNKMTQLSTIGVVQSLNIPFVTIMCMALVIFAMLSSYWTSSLALIDAMHMELRLNRNICIIICISITLLISIIFPLTILDYVQIGAGALSIIFGLIIIPAYFNSIKDTKNDLLLGKHAKSKVIMGIVIIATIVMAVSSFISID